MVDFFDKMFGRLTGGGDDPEPSSLEERHNLTHEDLFAKDRHDNRKYSTEPLYDGRLRKQALQWREDFGEDQQESLKRNVSDHMDLSSTDLTIDYEGVEQFYLDSITLEDQQFLNDERRVDAVAKASYRATEALESSIRDHVHGDLDSINYELDDGVMARDATVTDAMYAFNTLLHEENDLPDGADIGITAAIIDRRVQMDELEDDLSHEYRKMQMRHNPEDPKNLLEEEKTDYVQERLRKLGLPRDEVEAEYAMPRDY